MRDGYEIFEKYILQIKDIIDTNKEIVVPVKNMTDMTQLTVKALIAKEEKPDYKPLLLKTDLGERRKEKYYIKILEILPDELGCVETFDK